MELVRGQSLNQMIQSLKFESKDVSKLPELLQRYGTRRYWREIARIGRDAAMGLQHAHQRSVLHRDITPGNLLLDERGNVMLSDFGMARTISTDGSTGTQTIGGTLGYLPPETFSGKFDERSDIFGLGVTLYEMLTLQPAFYDASPAEALKRVAENSFRPKLPRSINDSIPKDVETIVLKCISHQPAQRYSSAHQLADDLQNFLDLRPISARRISAVEYAWRWCRRNRAIAMLSALAVMSLVAVSIAMTYSFIEARIATHRVTSAYERERVQRERSDASLKVATNVLNDIYEDLVPIDLQGFDAPAQDSSGLQQSLVSPVLSNEMVAVLDNLLKFYDQLAEQGGDNQELMLSSASALGRVADIYRQIGQPERALPYYTDALEKLEESKKQFSETTDLVLQQARIYNESGLLHHIEGRQAEAIKSHLQALEVLKSLDNSDLGDDPKLIYEMARAYYLLGRPKERNASEVALDHLTRGTPGRGRGGRGRGNRPFPLPPWLNNLEIATETQHRHECLSDAIKTLERLPVEDQGRPEHQFLLACCYRELSDPRENQNGVNLKPDIEHAIELLLDLVERYQHNPLYRYELMETFRREQRIAPRTQAELENAIDVLEKSLYHADYLTAQHPNVPQYAVARMHILHREGHVLVNRAEEISGSRRDELLHRAVLAFEQALDQAQTLVQRWPSSDRYKLWAIVVSGSLGKAMLDLEINSDAKTVLKRAVVWLGELEPQVVNNPQLKRQLPDVRRIFNNLVRRSQQ